MVRHPSAACCNIDQRSTQNNDGHVRSWTEQCWHKRSNQLKRKFKAERNFWIAAFALTLFVAVHRLRHHIKHHLKLLQLLDESVRCGASSYVVSPAVGAFGL